MAKSNLIEVALKRDRTLVILALVFIIGASWAYILTGAGMSMSAFETSSLHMALGLGEKMPVEVPIAGDGVTLSMSDDIARGKAKAMDDVMAAMATPANWTFGYAWLMFIMWWVMMTAMMLPSATPMILLHARIYRSDKTRAGEARLPATAAFTVGYLLAWGLFSALAALLQWSFERTGLLSPMIMNSTSTLFAGAILLFAGVYQLTPIKRACLRHCRGPIQFLAHHWRPGVSGALHMGIHHGAYCLGCCWGLMAILFFGGIMNLYWIIGLALIVLLEKMLPLGPRLSTVTGALFIIWGMGFMYFAVV